MEPKSSLLYFVSVVTLVAFGLFSATEAVEEDPFVRDSRIFTIDLGNSTTSLATLSYLGSIVALKTKIALAVAIFWAVASFFSKWVGALSICRASSGGGSSYYHDYGEHYGSSSLSPSYQDPSHSPYVHSYGHSGGLRPARANQPQESNFLSDFVELSKDRVMFTDMVIGAINDANCRHRLRCWASSFFPGSQDEPPNISNHKGENENLKIEEENECAVSNQPECPASRLSMALNSLTNSKHPNFSF